MNTRIEWNKEVHEDFTYRTLIFGFSMLQQCRDTDTSSVELDQDRVTKEFSFCADHILLTLHTKKSVIIAWSQSPETTTSSS